MFLKFHYSLKFHLNRYSLKFHLNR
jgi:hypothetical protein